MSNRRMARECALQSLYYADSAKTADALQLADYAADFKKELGACFPLCEELVTSTANNLPEIDK